MTHLGRYPIPIRHDQIAVHTRDRPDKQSMWSNEYEEEFWTLVMDLGSKLEFFDQLPSGFLSQIMETTWREPWHGRADAP